MKPQILESARKLIGPQLKPSELTAEHLVKAGTCSKSEFAKSFPDLAAFRRELLMILFAEAREAVIGATTNIKPGLGQLERAFQAYLDYNLERPALQELAHQVQFDPVAYELLVRMEAGVALIAQMDLEAAGASMSAARGRLLTTLCVAVVRAEYQAGRRLSEMRQALFDYCHVSAG